MEMITGWMVVTDPPVHKRLRRLAAKAFNPRRVAAMEDASRRWSTSSRRFIAAGAAKTSSRASRSRCPPTVIAELIGAPAEDADRFKDWSDDLAQVAFGAGGDERGRTATSRAMRGIERDVRPTSAS